MCTILIVKTSSFGDIVQTLHVASYLKQMIPNAVIEWAVMSHLAPIVFAHPHVDRVIFIDFKRPFRTLRHLRAKKYTYVFDFQGNCKSGLVVALSRSKSKVGESWKTLREWPAGLATHTKWNVADVPNVRLKPLRLLQRFFSWNSTDVIGGVSLSNAVGASPMALLKEMQKQGPLIMVCFGSKWPNKTMPKLQLKMILDHIANRTEARFAFVWGDEAELATAEWLHQQWPRRSTVVAKLSLPQLQHAMGLCDGVIAIDSGALHLCGTTTTPSFSMFGPTRADVFKPLGEHHVAIQGACPYGRTFAKQCSELRKCPTGACMQFADLDPVLESLMKWLQYVLDRHARRQL
ncbi:MAG: hypothetical protein RL235_1174 [Chlamydiota bacterium]|jgi:heptosyltransferase-1